MLVDYQYERGEAMILVHMSDSLTHRNVCAYPMIENPVFSNIFRSPVDQHPDICFVMTIDDSMEVWGCAVRCGDDTYLAD